MEFNRAEKLAIVKVIDSVIVADEIIHNGEINELGQLMRDIDFDSNFIVDARNIDAEQGLLVLSGMPDHKKNALAVILEGVAKADGFVHEKEAALLTSIFSTMGIGREIK